MSDRLTLRPYQSECVAAHYTSLSEPATHPLMVVPTGGGKSLIIADFIWRTLKRWPDTKILVLTHVKELIEQNHDELVRYWQGGMCPVGIYSAGLGSRDVHDQIIFGGVQSVARCDALLERHFHLVLIDEAHLVPKAGEGRYRTVLEKLTAVNPRLRVVGYTATHYRLDGGYLHEGEGAIFTDVAYEVTLDLLVEGGFLCHLRAKAPEHQIDTRKVRTRQGDFALNELEAAALAEDAVSEAVAEAVEILRREDRHHWLVFAIGIAHAEAIREALGTHGIQAETVFGKTPKDERAEITGRFRSGDLQALINVGCLTTGFNAPCCDAIIMMRPTKSAALYVQAMGRGMRTAPGKKDCLVLDYGGNVMRHGPVNRVEVAPPAEGDGTPPVKTCPECGELILIAVMECPACGFEFEREEKEPHERKASDLPVMDFTPKDPNARRPVTTMSLSRHKKEGKPDSLRVDYVVGGFDTCSEWVCLEHDGFARRMAERWWRRHSEGPIPVTVAEAIERLGELLPPSHALVIPEDRFKRIQTFHDDMEHSLERVHVSGHDSDALVPPEDLDPLPF